MEKGWKRFFCKDFFRHKKYVFSGLKLSCKDNFAPLVDSGRRACTCRQASNWHLKLCCVDRIIWFGVLGENEHCALSRAGGGSIISKPSATNSITEACTPHTDTHTGLAASRDLTIGS